MQVLNLRTLKPIDREAIAATVKKTHRMVFTEEGWPQSGIGAEIISIVNEEAFVRPHTLRLSHTFRFFPASDVRLSSSNDAMNGLVVIIEQMHTTAATGNELVGRSTKTAQSDLESPVGSF